MTNPLWDKAVGREDEIVWENDRPENKRQHHHVIERGAFPLRDKCEEKARRMEMPHFTLLACDNFTVGLVKQWIVCAETRGSSKAKIDEAKALLARIVDWRSENPSLCKVPD